MTEGKTGMDRPMACERCGCRMVARARGGRGELICTDCGHRADETMACSAGVIDAINRTSANLSISVP